MWFCFKVSKLNPTKSMNQKNFLKIFVLIFFIFFILSGAIFATEQKIKVIKDQEYFFVLQEAIRDAQKCIKVVVFEIGYYPNHPLSPSNILIHELILAKKRGVDVKVLLDVSEWNLKLTEKNTSAGKILSKGGVTVRYDSPKKTTHTKLVIIDDSFAILGSNNWTYYSLTQNRELAVLISYPPAIEELNAYFNELWEESRSLP